MLTNTHPYICFLSLGALTTKAEETATYAQLAAPTAAAASALAAAAGVAPLRLLYATPEKLLKSKRFLSKLEKLHEYARLGHIVIDECHCASETGNDFRPDYKKLSILRLQFPGEISCTFCSLHTYYLQIAQPHIKRGASTYAHTYSHTIITLT
jgi:superfamily II DNA helicase RecQ